MKLLALDASTEALSVALFDSERPDATVEIFDIAARAHARRLLPAARQLLDEAGIALAALDGIAFARGPGAFTGLRIAAGLAQGLAGGAGLPVIGISTLAAIAARAFDHAPSAARVQVVQDARMGEVYTACFRRGEGAQPIDAERVLAPSALTVCDDAATVAAGNGWRVVAEARAAPVPEPIVMWPHAADVARLAWPRLRAEGGPPESAIPVYVRDEVARRPGGRAS